MINDTEKFQLTFATALIKIAHEILSGKRLVTSVKSDTSGDYRVLSFSSEMRKEIE